MTFTAEDAFKASQEGKSEAEILEMAAAANTQSQSAANEQQQAAQEQQSAQAAQQQAAQQEQEQQQQQQQAAPTFDFSKYGVQSEEELQQRLSRYSELEATVTNNRDVLSAAAEIKNPFANEAIASLNSFVQKTGISDLSIASQFINSTDEQLKANPLRAMAIAEIISNPMLAEAGLSTVEKSVARKMGLEAGATFDDLDEDTKELLKVEAFKSLKTIQDKRTEISQGSNFFSNLQTQAQARAQAIQTASDEWNKAIPQIVSNFSKIQHKVDGGEGVGEILIDVAVSNEQVKQIANSLLPSLVSSGVPTEEAMKSVSQNIELYLRLANMDSMVKNAVENALKTKTAEIEERVRLETHNGGDPVNLGGRVHQKGELSPAELEFRRLQSK